MLILASRPSFECSDVLILASRPSFECSDVLILASRPSFECSDVLVLASRPSFGCSDVLILASRPSFECSDVLVLASRPSFGCSDVLVLASQPRFFWTFSPMKPLTWDSGYHFGDPNLYWGDPSYVLEPGDPGYVPPAVPPSPATPKKRTMTNNPIPAAERSILALAEDCADGAATLQDTVGLKQTREADLRALIAALKGNTTATPPTPGFLYTYKQRAMEQETAVSARRVKDEEAKDYLTAARNALVPILGRDPSTEWEQAGFSSPPASSNAVPGTQDGRLACLAALAVYLAQHPTYEIPAGGPRAALTAALTQALHTQLSAARQAANDAGTVQQTALMTKEAAFQTLRRRLIALVDELQLLLADDDPRWETFGLNVPANPRAPDAATNLTLTPAGPGRVLAEWDRGTRSTNDRVLIQVVGVDTDYHEYAKSGGDSQEVIKAQTPGATLKVKIVALNGSLEADSGPEAQLVVV